MLRSRFLGIPSSWKNVWMRVVPILKIGRRHTLSLILTLILLSWARSYYAAYDIGAFAGRMWTVTSLWQGRIILEWHYERPPGEVRWRAGIGHPTSVIFHPERLKLGRSADGVMTCNVAGFTILRTGTNRVWHIFAFPFWSVALLPALFSLRRLQRLLTRSRRKKNGLCQECGYDLRASHGQCPECGWSIKGVGRAL